MIVYKAVSHFDPSTGAKLPDRMVPAEWRCDFCGEIISNEYSPPSYRFDYKDHDACWGSSEPEYSFIEEFNDDNIRDSLFDEPYIFCSRFLCCDLERDWEECELLLANEVLFCAIQGGGYFKDVDSMIDAWRMSRIRAMKKLLDTQTITQRSLLPE